jgi:hypothetical protein
MSLERICESDSPTLPPLHEAVDLGALDTLLGESESTVSI